MRVWFDTDRTASLDLTPQDIATALEAQNTQTALGRVGATPIEPGTEHQYDIATEGRPAAPEEFGDMVVRADPHGAPLRVRDVARIELGAKSSDSNVRFRRPAVPREFKRSPSSGARIVVYGSTRSLGRPRRIRLRRADPRPTPPSKRTFAADRDRVPWRGVADENGGHRRYAGMVGVARPNPTEEPPMTDMMMSLRALVEKSPDADVLREPKAGEAR